MLEHARRKNTHQRPRDLRIGWVHVGKRSPCHIAALQIAYDNDLDVLCVQEPYTCNNTRTSTHPGFSHHQPVHEWINPFQERGTRPRVMTYTRIGAELQLAPRLSLENRDLLWIDVNGISILNVYRQPQDPYVIEYTTHLTPPPRCVAGGDFNAKHDTFEPGIQAEHGGGDLAQWSADTGMDYIGEPGRATHRAGHVIDLSFSNIPFAKTTVRTDLNCGSDHETVVTVTPGQGRRLLQQFHYRIPESRLPQFTGLVELEMHHVPSPALIQNYTTTTEIEHWAEALTGELNRAIKMIGKPDRERGRSAPWWNENCAIAHRRHLGSLQNTNACRPTEETRDFLREVRQAKRAYWRHTIDDITNDKALYKIVGWHKLEPTQQETPLKNEGKTLSGPGEKAEALREAILCRFSSEDDIDAPPDMADINPRLPWDTHFSLEETERNTIGVSSTSPGVDRVTVRLLKACWEHIRYTVRALYQRCLFLSHFPTQWKLAEVAMIPKIGKKDKTSVRSWRPIALLSCMGKGLERIIARRIAWTAMTCGVLSPQHGGALPKRSAMDLVAAFTHDVEEAFARGQHVAMVTMDVQGAFDALLKNRLLHRMRDQGWGASVIRMIDCFLSDRQVRV